MEIYSNKMNLILLDTFEKVQLCSVAMGSCNLDIALIC